MGVHTGDSITVAPAQTLSDTELQRLRDYSLAILEKVGVATGGSNVQFAVNPEDGRIIVVEMNPRVSRSSALASKATGFPIAKVAARLAVGLTLDEVTNDITQATPACFEPSIDYCVVKVPRFAFEKFKGTDETLSTRMKAVGEVMAIGRTFEESFNKAMRSLEVGENMLGADDPALYDVPDFRQRVSVPTAQRIYYVIEALRRGWSIEDIYELTGIDPWYLSHLKNLTDTEGWLAERRLTDISERDMRSVKQMGFSDEQIAHFTGSTELEVRAWRKAKGVTPAIKTVDTCGGEFPARTSYHYKTYEWGPSERRDTDKPRAMILSAGPNRIGQGIEFDYCCVPCRLRPARQGLRDGHGQLQPRDGLHGLRHLGPSLLRAAHVRGRHGHRGRGAARGRHLHARRPDAHQPGRAPQGRGRAHHGHPARRPGPRRGPRALQRAS